MEQNRIAAIDGMFAGGPPPREEYFAALTAEAVRCGILSEAEEADLRRQVMELLAERIRLFTDGESTALREETAQALLASVLYNMSIALLAAGDHRAAAELLRTKSAVKLHDDGMVITMRTQKRAELLSLLLMKHQQTGMSEGYNRFVGRDAYRWVRAYDPLYGAAEELYVRIDEMGIRETVRGIMRMAEIMTELIRRSRG